LAAHRGFGDESRHGAGGLVMTDQSGLLRRTTIAANYAFRIKVRLSRVKFGYLSMGLQGAAIQNSFNGGDVELQEQNDPSIPESGQSSFTPDIGTGVFFNTDRWYVGGSITHLAEFEMGFPDEDGSEAQLTRHYNFTGGIDIPTSRFDRKVVISPSFFVRSANQAPWQFDANVNVTFLQKFWVGGLYRFQDAVAVLAGVYPTPNLRIGYSYDITTSDLAPYNNGTHEISVSYDFGFDKPTIKSPRFF
jgi:type IX secretion system PorP/SprF family membrane protein